MTSVKVSGAYRAFVPDERGGPVTAVEDMLRLLGKASRAHQLYLHNNPTYLRALELLRDAFAPLWDTLPELTLTVGEHDLRWDERTVYQEPERGGDSLPWLLFKDGIREITLLPGFEAVEVERLLEVLRLLGRASANEDDAITLFWECDFGFLRHRFVEPVAEDAGVAGFALGASPGRLEASHGEEVYGAAATEEEQPAGIVSIADFDGTPYFLAERELEYLRAALEREYAHDLHADVVAILLDTFETQSAEAVRADICLALEELMLQALGSGSYRAVARLVREATVTLERAPDVADDQRRRLSTLTNQLGTAEGLGRLVDALDVVEALPSDAELEALFSQLQPSALGPVLGWIDRVQTVRLRSALRAAAERLALAHSGELARLITSADAAVAREAVQRAGALKATAAVPALGGILRGAPAELRAMAAAALAEIGSTGAMQLLAALLDDGDREVRLIALRAVARGYRAALSPLEDLVRGKRLRAADLTEQMAVFEAYGALCGDDGVASLDRLLNGRSLLGRREDAQVRACAAVALGRIGSDRARIALVRAANEKDVVVRTAVQRAMRSGG